MVIKEDYEERILILHEIFLNLTNQGYDTLPVINFYIIVFLQLFGICQQLFPNCMYLINSLIKNQLIAIFLVRIRVELLMPRSVTTWRWEHRIQHDSGIIEICTGRYLRSV